MKKVPNNEFIKLATLCLYHTDSENSRAVAVESTHVHYGKTISALFFDKIWSLPDRKWMRNGIQRHIYKIHCSFGYHKTQNVMESVEKKNARKFTQKLKTFSRSDKSKKLQFYVAFC